MFEPKQSRSMRTREALLSAFEELLKQKQFDDIGVADIAREAGVSTASIYRRFGKRDGLLTALFELYTKRMEQWFTAHVPIPPKPDPGSLSLREFLRENIRLLLLLIGDLQHLAKPIAVFGRTRPDLIPTDASEQLKERVQSMVEILKVYQSEVAHADTQLAAHMTIYFLQTMPYDYLLFRDQMVFPGCEITLEMFEEQLTDFVYRYLVHAE